MQSIATLVYNLNHILVSTSSICNRISSHDITICPYLLLFVCLLAELRINRQHNAYRQIDPTS